MVITGTLHNYHKRTNVFCKNLTIVSAHIPCVRCVDHDVVVGCKPADELV